MAKNKKVEEAEVISIETISSGTPDIYEAPKYQPMILQNGVAPSGISFKNFEGHNFKGKVTNLKEDFSIDGIFHSALNHYLVMVEGAKYFAVEKDFFDAFFQVQ